MIARHLAKHLARACAGLTGCLLLVMTLTSPPAAAQDLDNTVYLDLEWGRVVIELHPDLAPRHVARIKELVGDGFYDGLVFHRVIDGFMAQTGDPLGIGIGGSGLNLPAEFSNAPFERGTVGMARAANPDSADSQFFITFQRAPWLDGQYTVWGTVVEGMEHVDRITRGEPPENPDSIVRMQIASQAEAQ